MTKRERLSGIKVRYRVRGLIGLSLAVLSIIPLFTVIILYESEGVEPGHNVLILIPIMLLLSLRTIITILEDILIKSNLMKIMEFSEKIQNGEYDSYFDLPMQTDEENYYVQVVRSLESLGRYVRGQNRMLLGNLKEARNEAEIMKELAVKDGLTGLFNRRYFDAAMTREAKKAYQGESCLSLIMLDCDKFKQVNDTFGHDAGDRVLKELSKAIVENVREEKDIPFRFGGDEFGIIMPGVDMKIAERVMRRLVLAYNASDIKGTSLSISIVSAMFRNEGTVQQNITAMIKKADEGIYTIKRNGGNGIKDVEISF